jgi:hypothetical protein
MITDEEAKAYREQQAINNYAIAVNGLIKYYRAMRKSRSADFVEHDFNDFAKNNNMPEDLRAQALKVIMDPTLTFHINFNPYKPDEKTTKESGQKSSEENKEVPGKEC